MLLKILKTRWRDGAIGGLLIAVIMLLTQIVNLRKSRLPYENPATTNSVHEESVKGPVVTVTRTWKAIPTSKRPSRNGDSPVATKEVRWEDGPYAEKTETIEWKGIETNTKTAAWTKTPLAVDTSENKNRWLLSAGATRFSGDLDGKYGMFGYSWGNRFDLRAGAIRLNSEIRPMVDGTIRF